MVDPAGSAPVPALAHTLAYGEQCLYTEVYGDRGFSIRGLIITGTLEKPKCECFRDRERIVLFFEADLFGQDLRICLGRLLLLSVFTLMVMLTGEVFAEEMLIQFFLPYLVTCCICFRVLSSRRIGSEVFALFL